MKYKAEIIRESIGGGYHYEIFKQNEQAPIVGPRGRSLDDAMYGVGLFYKGLHDPYAVLPRLEWKRPKDDSFIARVAMFTVKRGAAKNPGIAERVKRVTLKNPYIDADVASYVQRIYGGEAAYRMLDRWLRVFPEGNYKGAVKLADRIAALAPKPRLAHLAEALQYQQYGGMELLRALAEGVDPTPQKEFTEPKYRGGRVVGQARAKEILG